MVNDVVIAKFYGLCTVKSRKNHPFEYIFSTFYSSQSTECVNFIFDQFGLIGSLFRKLNYHIHAWHRIFSENFFGWHTLLFNNFKYYLQFL